VRWAAVIHSTARDLVAGRAAARRRATAPEAELRKAVDASSPSAETALILRVSGFESLLRHLRKTVVSVS
jgi:hypothetical protein